MNENWDDASWHRPLPGNANAISSEVERFTLLGERLRAAADDLNGVSARWAGHAHERFVDVRTAVAGQWRHAGDLCDRAARALAQYHRALLELRRLADERARQADYGSDLVGAPAAWADIERLREQLRQQGAEAAQVIRDCAQALAAFTTTFVTSRVDDQRPQPSVATAAGPLPQPDPAPRHAVGPQQRGEQPGSIDPDPSLAAADPATFERTVRVLAAEILVGQHFVIATAGSDQGH
jgi:hypothetical protein